MKILKYIIFSLILTLSLSGGEVIETLPTRERAEMNIEVTKVFSEKLDALLDESNKEITLNFKETTIDESQFEVFLIENLNTLPSYSVSKGGRRALEVIKNGAKLRAGSKITTGKLSYFLDRAKGKKALKIQYEEKPEKLYLGVLNKSTNTVAKVFSINYDTKNNFVGAMTNSVISGFSGDTTLTFSDNGNFNDEFFHQVESNAIVTTTLDGFNDNSHTFRLSAIIGGSSNLNGDGGTKAQGTSPSENTTTGYKQPKVKVGNLILPIKLNLTSANDVQIFKYKMHQKDTELTTVALRGKTTTLITKFQPYIDNDIIVAARKVKDLNVLLTWDTTEGQINQVAFPKADYNNYGSVPHASNNRTDIAPYPNLKIVKNQTTHSGTIEFSSRTEPTIKNTSDSNFLKGLKYKGYVGVFNTTEDTKELVYSSVSGEGVSDGGDSSELQFTKTNTSGNSITFKIKYNKGEPTYELVSYTQVDYAKDKPSDRTFDFVIKYFEESGLVRKTDSVTVIVPTMRHEVTTNIPGEVIFYDDGDNIESIALQNNYYVFAGGSMKYKIENIPNSYPSYFPVISLYNGNVSTPFGDSNLGNESKAESSDSYHKVKFNNKDEKIIINLYFGFDYEAAKTKYRVSNLSPFEIVQKIGIVHQRLVAFMLGGYIQKTSITSTTSATAEPPGHSALLRFRIPPSIFIENRGINQIETPLPYINNNENIKFVVGKRTETQSNENLNTFVYPTGNTTTSINFPPIKIVKNQITRDMTMTIDRNYDEEFIDFDASGSTSKSGITLSSGFNMKGLPFKSNIIIKNKGITNDITHRVVGEDIDGGGNTTQNINFDVTGINGKKAKIELKYGINGLPSLAVRDWTGPDTFKIQILHNEYSGLNRRTYNLDITTPDTNRLVLTKNNILPESIYLDKDRKKLTSEANIATYAVFDGGSLELTLYNFTNNRFPAVTVGNAHVVQGNRYSPPTSIQDLKLKYENHEFETRVHFWTNGFETNNNIFFSSHLGKEVITGRHNNVSPNDNLVTSTNLRMNIPESEIVYFRRYVNSDRIELIAQNPTVDVITSTIGKKDGSGYTVTNDFALSERIAYPKVILTKDNVNVNGLVTLNTNYQKGTRIDFDKSDIPISDGVRRDSMFPRGLSYGGTMEIYQLRTKIGETMNVNGLDKYTGAGDTDKKYEFTLKDHLGRDAKISLQYRTDGLVSFSLDEWEGEGEINFIIFHKEGSGLTRKTTNMKIVTPKIGEKISSDVLDFGVLLKGSNINYTAETSIVVQPFSGHNLILELDDSNKEKVSLTNGNSTVEATRLSVDSGEVNGTNKVFKLSGVITKGDLDNSTAEGSHTGTVTLQMKVVPATTVNLNNK